MSAFTRLGKNTALIMVGNASSKVLTLLMLPLYTSWLSVEDFGTTDIISVYTTLLVGVVSCCIADAIFVIPKGQDFESLRKYFTSGIYFLCIASAVTAFIFYILNLLFQFLNLNNSFSNNIEYIYFILITGVFNTYFQQFCRSIDKIAIYSIAGIVFTIATAIFSFLFIPHYGVYGYVCATIFSNISVVVYIVLTAGVYHYFKFDCYQWYKLKDLLQYSIPLIPNALMWWFVLAANKPVLEHFCGLIAVGLLAVAGKFPGFLNVLLTAFNSSWVISVIEEYKNKDFTDFFNKGLKLFAFILTAFAILICIFSDVITRIFTSNPDYYEAWIYIPMLALSTVFSCMAGLVGAVFSAVKKSKYYFYSSVWSAVSSIILNYLLIRYFLLWGAVFATALSMAIMLLSRIVFAKKYVSFDCYKSFLTSLFFFSVVYFVKATTSFVLGFSISFLLFFIYTFINKEFLLRLKQILLERISCMLIK